MPIDFLGQIAVWLKPVRDTIKAKLTDEESAKKKEIEAERAAVNGTIYKFLQCLSFLDVAHLFDDDDDVPRKKLKRKKKTSMLDSDDEDIDDDGVEVCI